MIDKYVLWINQWVGYQWETRHGCWMFEKWLSWKCTLLPKSCKISYHFVVFLTYSAFKYLVKHSSKHATNTFKYLCLCLPVFGWLGNTCLILIKDHGTLSLLYVCDIWCLLIAIIVRKKNLVVWCGELFVICVEHINFS